MGGAGSLTLLVGTRIAICSVVPLKAKQEWKEDFLNLVQEVGKKLGGRVLASMCKTKQHNYFNIAFPSRIITVPSFLERVV